MPYSVVVMMAFTVGIVLGGFSVQGYSAEWLKQVGVIVAVLTALSAGVLNLIKLQDMKQQQRWELQKPMLLGLLTSLMQLEELMANAVNHYYIASQPDDMVPPHKRAWSNKQIDRLTKEMGPVSNNAGQLMRELREVWGDGLPKYLADALEEYRVSLALIEKSEKNGDLNPFEAYDEETKLISVFLPSLRDACVEMSGVLK